MLPNKCCFLHISWTIIAINNTISTKVKEKKAQFQTHVRRPRPAAKKVSKVLETEKVSFNWKVTLTSAAWLTLAIKELKTECWQPMTHEVDGFGPRQKGERAESGAWAMQLQFYLLLHSLPCCYLMPVLSFTTNSHSQWQCRRSNCSKGKHRWF